jgi:hypothetical protein
MQQDQWVHEQVATHLAAEKAGGRKPAGAFWYAVSLVLEQISGLLEGYNARVQELGSGSGMDSLRMKDLLLINALGDMNDLLPMFVTDNDEDVRSTWGHTSVELGRS